MKLRKIPSLLLTKNSQKRITQINKKANERKQFTKKNIKRMKILFIFMLLLKSALRANAAGPRKSHSRHRRTGRRDFDNVTAATRERRQDLKKSSLSLPLPRASDDRTSKKSPPLASADGTSSPLARSGGDFFEVPSPYAQDGGDYFEVPSPPTRD